MFTLKSEHSFDAAHFLSGYKGKCSNIHGHRWRVTVEINSAELKSDEHLRGMIVDFDKLKEDLKKAQEKNVHQNNGGNDPDPYKDLEEALRGYM